MIHSATVSFNPPTGANIVQPDPHTSAPQSRNAKDTTMLERFIFEKAQIRRCTLSHRGKRVRREVTFVNFPGFVNWSPILRLGIARRSHWQTNHGFINSVESV